MWLLISERGESFLITPGEEHIVSRKGGSITLSDDQSISRLHAKIFLNNDDPNTDFGLTLVDTSSKYGTYVNEGIETSTRTTENEKILLNHDDLVRFGLQWNKWRVVFMPLLVLTSTLRQPEKQQVKSQIEKLGGKMISNWSPQCTHLTMNQITLTVKVVSSLGAGQHIVTPKYWQNLLLAVQTKQRNLPDPTDYVPPLNEATLNENQVSFKLNRNRSTLFKNKLFVATSPRQKSRIEPMVISAGGKVAIFDECNMTEKEFCKEGVILMQSSPFASPSDELSQIPAAYQVVSKYLSSKRLRCIPESDIGLSVVYCSCEKFCNPRYNAQSIFECHPVPVQQTESLPVIVQDTQNTPIQPSGFGKVIDDTMAAIAAFSGKSNKRPPNNNDEEENRPFKKPSIGGDKQFLNDICSDQKGKLPGIFENDIFVCNFESKKDNQEEDSGNYQRKNKDSHQKKEIVMETDSNEGLRNDNQSEEIFKSKNYKKRHVISDDEDDGNEFCLPSQKRKIDNSTTSKDNTINKKDKVKNVVVDDSDEDDFSFSSKKKQIPKPSDEEDDFSFSSKKKQTPKQSDEEDDFSFSSKKKQTPKQSDEEDDFSFLSKKKQIPKPSDEEDDFSFSSKKKQTPKQSDEEDDFSFSSKKKQIPKPSDEEDDFSFSSKKKQTLKPSSCLFDSERDIFDPSLKNNDSFKPPKSVDMFATSSSSSNRKDKKRSNLFEDASKNSDDMFGFTSSKKSLRNIDESDFELSDVRKIEKHSSDYLQKNNILKLPESINDSNDELINQNENPFQSKKLSRDIFEPSTSDGRGMKRKISIDEPPSKKPTVVKDTIENNDVHEFSGNRNPSCRKSPERILNEEVIKREPIDATIKDEELHDSTIIIVNSLIVPMKSIIISNQSNGKKKNCVSFKKFRKVTPLKMPNLIDLVAFEEKNNDCWANITFDSDDDEHEDKDEWSFKQSQALKGTKIRSRKAR